VSMTIMDELEAIRCCECATVFAVQKTVLDLRRQSHKTFTCPNGHEQAFLAPKPKVDPDADRIAKLTADLAAVTKRAETLAAWIARAPHLATCNVRVDRPCDCGRVECIGDVAAPEVTSAS